MFNNNALLCMNLAAWQGTGPWASLDRLHDSVCSIVRCVAFMKRIFSHTVAALAAGLCLRLFFAFKFPFAPTDTALYEQLATNWLQHHVYAMTVDGALGAGRSAHAGLPRVFGHYLCDYGPRGPGRAAVRHAGAGGGGLGCLPVDRRSRGAAGIAEAESGELAARLYRDAVDCRALPVHRKLCGGSDDRGVRMVFHGGCPGVADRTDLGCSAAAKRRSFRAKWAARHAESIFALTSGFLIGMGTLFRPETPLLLVAAWILLAFIWLRKRRFLFWSQLVVLSAIGCVLPLAPWAVRNAVTLHEVQFLAPKNLNMSGEFVPRGFMAWEKTWLFRMKDCFLVPWKLDGEVINLEDIPARAFDTPDEKDRVAALLEQYNNDVTITPEEDAAFGQLARERTARHPLRTYVWLPVARAFTIWFTPRIELLPFSGKVFPVREAWREDPIDLSVTLSYFFLNVSVRCARDLGSLAIVAGELRASAGGRTAAWVRAAAHRVSHHARNARAPLRAGVLSGDPRAGGTGFRPVCQIARLT